LIDLKKFIYSIHLMVLNRLCVSKKQNTQQYGNLFIYRNFDLVIDLSTNHHEFVTSWVGVHNIYYKYIHTYIHTYIMHIYIYILIHIICQYNIIILYYIYIYIYIYTNDYFIGINKLLYSSC
jgi:hypothetical protein